MNLLSLQRGHSRLDALPALPGLDGVALIIQSMTIVSGSSGGEWKPPTEAQKTCVNEKAYQSGVHW